MAEQPGNSSNQGTISDEFYVLSLISFFKCTENSTVKCIIDYG